MDLCRRILLQLEEQEQPAGWVDFGIEGYSSDEVSYHVRLLADAGLIEARDLTTMQSAEWKPKRLTWAGHEFIDAARNERIWCKTKALVIEKTGALTLDLLKAGLAEVARGLLSGKFSLP